MTDSDRSLLMSGRPTGERAPAGASGHPAEEILRHLPDPVVVLDPDGTVHDATPRVGAVVGWEAHELVGTSVVDLIHPDDLNLVVSALATVTTKEDGELLSLRIRTPAGHWVPVEVHGRAATIDGHQRIVLAARDVTRRHHLDLDAGDETVLRAVMANMHGMVALVGPDGSLRSINAAVTRVLGHDPELITGASYLDFVHHLDQDRVEEAVRALRPGESAHLDARFRCADESADHVTCEFTVNDMTQYPTVGAYIVSGHVASALHDARRRVDFLAEHDSRTGLLNRDGFLRSVHEMTRQGGGLGLMIVDIAQFRAINELYGEDAGDAVLTAVADRIDAVHWPDLVAARFGGDEFVLALRSSNDGALEMLRERIRRDIALPVDVGEHRIQVVVRVATAFEPVPQGLDSLLANASNELMRLKRNAEPGLGGASVDTVLSRRRHLDQLKAALASDEIRPFFQPIVSSRERIVAVEALVRWVHPVRGVLGVDQILPLAQMAGLAEQVDEHVFGAAFAFARRLADDGHADVEVHVNVDPRVIARSDFADSFLRSCAQAGADPGQIVVELTETDLLAPGVSSLENMHQLRRAGTHVSIDDFGTGYSSLSHLLELPVDGVKIDRRFVAGIDVDPAATNLTTAILGLSDSLSLACVAEGVEQRYQRDRLAALGCDAFQGWLYSPAVSPDELMAMLPSIDRSDAGLSR